MDKLEKTTMVNPRWVKPTMTLQQAANQAGLRGFTLRVSWTSIGGVRVVAEPKELGL